MKLSVIVTTWGCETWIDACRASIRSAREACPVEVEVIEVCDGRGVSVARNEGLRLATGDWLVFVDGDDVIASNYFCEIASRAEEADLLRFRLVRFWEEREWKRGERMTPFPWCWQACAYHRRILPPEGFPPLTSGEDNLFLLRCLKRAKCVRDADIPVYGYRQHVDSAVWRKPTMRRFEDRLAYARLWLNESVGFGDRQRGVRLVVRDALGVPSLELRTLGPQAWKLWRAHLKALASLRTRLPVVSRLQVFVCLTFRWHWVTRLAVEWPTRMLMHYGC